MRILATLAAAAGLVALSACGGGAEENAAENFDANMMTTDNFGMPADNMMMDMNTGMDMNGDMNMDMNADVNMDMNMADGNTATNEL